MDSTTGQQYYNVKKFEQNDFVDVCSTEDNYDNKENKSLSGEAFQNDLHKSPNSLIATFSRMSPFKLRQSNNQPSCQASLSSSNNISRKLFGSSSTSKSSLMQRFANFTSFDVLSPTTSGVSDNQKNESIPIKQSKAKIEFVEKKSNRCSSLYESKPFGSLSNIKKQTDASILYPSTSFLYDDKSIPNDFSESEIKNSAFIINDDAESEIDDPNNSSDNVGIKTSRKEKSLGKLCRRFLLTMGEEAKTSTNDIHLESVARKMNVEKRRIYDIVNVMEALEAMSKTNKSFYRWHGLSALPQLMDTLQKEAIKEKIPERIKQVEKAMCNFIDLKSVKILQPPKNNSYIVGSFIDNCAIKKCHSTPSIKDTSLSSKSFNDSETSWTDNSSNNLNSSIISNDSVKLKFFENDRGIGNCAGGKNSLAQLCRRFLMVLLSNPSCNRRVSLDVASTILIKNTESEGFEPPSRGRCRRLYDIANVLVAMELIRKVHYLFGTKKIPLFIYCGPEPDASPISAKLSMQEFLKRIGLSAIDTVPDNINKNENNNENNKKTKSSFNYSSQQKNRKIRIPRVHSQNTFENKIYPAASSLSLNEKFMPPLVPNKFNHLKNDEQHQSLTKISLLEFSTASKSLSSSTSSLSSTLSQSSSSSSTVQHLAEMAEMMRKRIHTTATSLSMPFLERKNDLINSKNKENKTKSFKFKRQKISSIINENINTQKTTGTLNINQLGDLPKPQPVNPLTSLNFSQSPQQQKTHLNNAMNAAAAMSGLFKGLSPQINSTSTASSLVELSNNYNTQNMISSFAPFTNDTSLSFFMMHPALASTTPPIVSTSNILEQHQKIVNKPKVAHSVSAILGNSQSDNITNNNQLNQSLTLSPKAFKPLNYNN